VVRTAFHGVSGFLSGLLRVVVLDDALRAVGVASRADEKVLHQLSHLAKIENELEAVVPRSESSTVFLLCSLFSDSEKGQLVPITDPDISLVVEVEPSDGDLVNFYVLVHSQILSLVTCYRAETANATPALMCVELAAVVSLVPAVRAVDVPTLDIQRSKLALLSIRKLDSTSLDLGDLLTEGKLQEGRTLQKRSPNLRLLGEGVRINPLLKYLTSSSLSGS
jgi:hypothetical protein